MEYEQFLEHMQTLLAAQKRLSVFYVQDIDRKFPPEEVNRRLSLEETVKEELAAERHRGELAQALTEGIEQ